MITGVLERVLQAFGQAMLLMAFADDEYWLVRDRLLDPELARLLPGPGASVGGDEGARLPSGDDAVLEAEWLLAAAREEDAVPAA